jgi:hypothetical protein
MDLERLASKNGYVGGSVKKVKRRDFWGRVVGSFYRPYRLRMVLIYGEEGDLKSQLIRTLKESMNGVVIKEGGEGKPRIHKSLLRGVYVIDTDKLIK